MLSCKYSKFRLPLRLGSMDSLDRSPKDRCQPDIGCTVNIHVTVWSFPRSHYIYTLSFSPAPLIYYIIFHVCRMSENREPPSIPKDTVRDQKICVDKHILLSGLWHKSFQGAAPEHNTKRTYSAVPRIYSSVLRIINNNNNNKISKD